MINDIKHIIFVLLVAFAYSCKNDPVINGQVLQSQKWFVSCWLGQSNMDLKSTGKGQDWEATFLPAGKFIKSFTIETTEPMFDAHGNEVSPGTKYSDSCFTYEIRNDLLKISSHGHGPKEDVSVYRIISGTSEDQIKLTRVQEGEFK